MANMEKLDRVLRFIEEHPENYYQGVWANHITEPGAEYHAPTPEANWCGTTACLAGWTVLLEGRHLAWRQFTRTSVADASAVAISGRPIRAVAEEILELEPHQADYLFYSSRTAAQIEAAVELLRHNPHVQLWQALRFIVEDEEEEG